MNKFVAVFLILFVQSILGEYAIAQFSLVKPLVALKIYNILGQEVAALINENRDAGQHSVQWNARSLSSGVYFYRLYAHPTDAKQTGDFMQTKKLLLLK